MRSRQRYTRWSGDILTDLQREELINDDKNQNLGFDIVMSNPPFAGDIQEKTIINLYSDILGYRYSFKIETGKVKAMMKTVAAEFGVTWTEEAETLVLDKVKEINKDDEFDLEQEDGPAEGDDPGTG